jgi:hypothetical protein
MCSWVAVRKWVLVGGAVAGGASVLGQRRSVGLHARSVAACGIVGVAGAVRERRLTADHGEILGWVRSLPMSVLVSYEAGPAGLGLPGR